MSYRHLPLPDFPEPEEWLYHVIALALDPGERGHISYVKVTQTTTTTFIEDPRRAVDHWHQAGRTAADLFTLTTRD